MSKTFGIAESINNGKIIKIEPIDTSLKKKCIAYCYELSFGILSYCYINIETTNIFCSDIEINEFSTFLRIC